MVPPFLVLNSIRKNYGTYTALGGVSFSVNKGELFGLLGPNGAGKTTLMGILAGLTPADAGTVTLAQLPFHPHDRTRRQLVGLGTQDLAVYPELSARENLRFFGKLYGMGGADLATRAKELLAAVGLADRADDRVGTFSGGMKRRLNLAVAVVHRPQLLLLDEPTTGVDPQSRNSIFEQVKALNAAGMTIIYTSHYMEEVQTLCTRIAILDAGQVKACDTLEHLLALQPSRVTLVSPQPLVELAKALRSLPGVKRVVEEVGQVTLEADRLSPILPAVMKLCQERDISLTQLIPTETNLERVFLELTGKAIRD